MAKKSEPTAKSPSGVYLIQDTRQYVGNAVLWWCPKGAGYTTNLNKAGRFSEEEANTGRDTDRAIPVEAAVAAASHVVDADPLYAALSKMREAEAP